MPGETFELPVRFPEHPTDEEDAYLCTAIKLPDQPLKLVGIEATSDQRIVHHMLLFGEAPPTGRSCLRLPAGGTLAWLCGSSLQVACYVCANASQPCCGCGRVSRALSLLSRKQAAVLGLPPILRCCCSVPAPGCQVPAQTAEVWNCRMSPVCGTASEGVLYGWGKNAPAVAMPQGSGFSVGPGTGIRSLVLQARPCAAAQGHLRCCKGFAKQAAAMQACTCQCLLPLLCSPLLLTPLLLCLVPTPFPQMHYLHGRPANDTSGIKLRLSSVPVPYSAGMVAFASMFKASRKLLCLECTACAAPAYAPVFMSSAVCGSPPAGLACSAASTTPGLEARHCPERLTCFFPPRRSCHAPTPPSSRTAAATVAGSRCTALPRACTPTRWAGACSLPLHLQSLVWTARQNSAKPARADSHGLMLACLSPPPFVPLQGGLP